MLPPLSPISFVCHPSCCITCISFISIQSLPCSSPEKVVPCEQGLFGRQEQWSRNQTGITFLQSKFRQSPIVPKLVPEKVDQQIYLNKPRFPFQLHSNSPLCALRDSPRLKRTRNLRQTNSRWSSCRERSLATSSWAWLNRLLRVAPACDAITA